MQLLNLGLRYSEIYESIKYQERKNQIVRDARITDESSHACISRSSYLIAASLDRVSCRKPLHSYVHVRFIVCR